MKCLSTASIMHVSIGPSNLLVITAKKTKNTNYKQQEDKSKLFTLGKLVVWNEF